tara:strand:- start:862 stop:1356 length:495 start_codon:yes stop_codon:yes gene_type:complete
MSKYIFNLKELFNKKSLIKSINKLKGELIPGRKIYFRKVSEFSVKIWSKSMKAFGSLNLRNQAIIVIILVIVSFSLGFSFGKNKTSGQFSSNYSSRIQENKCDIELWKRVNIECRGDANCAGRTYREASGGDVKGGLDCIQMSLKNKISTFKKNEKSSEYNFLK